MGSTTEKITQLRETKSRIKAAIESKGVAIADGSTFRDYASTINDISSGGQLNIAYGDTAPEDTSKLWVKSDSKNDVRITPSVDDLTFATTLNSLPDELGGSYHQMGYSVPYAVVGSKIYLFGGTTYDGLKTTTFNIYEFDAETETSRKLTVTLPDIERPSVAAVGTKVYLFGGIDWNTSAHEYTNAIYEFDTKTETMTQLDAVLSVAIYGIKAVTVGTKIYLLGGSTDSAVRNLVYIFDAETKTITELNSYVNRLKVSSRNMGTALVGTKIYMFGGQIRDYSVSYFLVKNTDSIQVFDTATNTSTRLIETLPVAASGVICIADDTRIYLFGGFHTPSVSSRPIGFETIYVFDTVTETLTDTGVTITHYASTGYSVNGNFYTLGGYNPANDQAVNTITKYQIGNLCPPDQLLIHTDPANDTFPIINSTNLSLKLGIDSVYVGTESGVATKAQAYICKDGTWTEI